MKEIKAYPLNDREYLADDLRKWAYATTTGVFSLENNLQTTTNNSMSVSVSKGMAFMNDGNGGLSIWSEEDNSLMIEPADGLMNRVDAVAMCWDKTDDKTYVYVKSGIGSKNPEAPTPQRDNTVHELVLAHIRVDAGTTKITSQMITDTRIQEDICGLVRNSVESIPTEQITKQFEEYLEELKKKLEDAGEVQLIDGAVSLLKLNASLRNSLVLQESGKLVDFAGNSLLNLVYPVGITIEFDRLNDPNKLFGGTWERTHVGRFAVGIDEKDSVFALGVRRGSKLHVHGERNKLNGQLAAAIGSTNNSVNHLGYITHNNNAVGSLGRAMYSIHGASSSTNGTFNHWTAVFGETATAETLPPYETAYFWKRIA